MFKKDNIFVFVPTVPPEQENNVYSQQYISQESPRKNNTIPQETRSKQLNSINYYSKPQNNTSDTSTCIYTSQGSLFCKVLDNNINTLIIYPLKGNKEKI